MSPAVADSVERVDLAPYRSLYHTRRLVAPWVVGAGIVSAALTIAFFRGSLLTTAGGVGLLYLVFIAMFVGVVAYPTTRPVPSSAELSSTGVKFLFPGHRRLVLEWSPHGARVPVSVPTGGQSLAPASIGTFWRGRLYLPREWGEEIVLRARASGDSIVLDVPRRAAFDDGRNEFLVRVTASTDRVGGSPARGS